MGIIGLPIAWSRERVITVVVVMLIISRIVFFAPYWGWYSGGDFEPRYVLPAVPVLALGIMEIAKSIRHAPALLQAGAVALTGLSIVIGFVGGAVNYQTDAMYTALRHESVFHHPTSTAHEFLNVYEAPSTGVIVDRHMFDWAEFPITSEIVNFFHRDHMASDTLNRPSDKVRGGAALGLFALGAIGLRLGRRTLPRHADDRHDESAGIVCG